MTSFVSTKSTISEYVILKKEHLLHLIKFIEKNSNKKNENQIIELLENCYESMILIAKENVSELLDQEKYTKIKKTKKKIKKKKKKEEILNHSEKVAHFHMKIVKELRAHLHNSRESAVLPRSKKVGIRAKKIEKYLEQKDSKKALKNKKAKKKVPKEEQKVQKNTKDIKTKKEEKEEEKRTTPKQVMKDIEKKEEKQMLTKIKENNFSEKNEKEEKKSFLKFDLKKQKEFFMPKEEFVVKTEPIQLVLESKEFDEEKVNFMLIFFFVFLKFKCGSTLSNAF